MPPCSVPSKGYIDTIRRIARRAFDQCIYCQRKIDKHHALEYKRGGWLCDVHVLGHKRNAYYFQGKLVFEKRNEAMYTSMESNHFMHIHECVYCRTLYAHEHPHNKRNKHPQFVGDCPKCGKQVRQKYEVNKYFRNRSSQVVDLSDIERFVPCVKKLK